MQGDEPLVHGKKKNRFVAVTRGFDDKNLVVPT